MLRKMRSQDYESEIEALEKIERDTSEFIQSIFDYVAILKAQSLLAQLYNFRRSIESQIAELRKEFETLEP